MEKTKKTFGEIWSELNSEQTEFLRDYINRQRQDAVKHYKDKQCDIPVVSNCVYVVTETDDYGRPLFRGVFKDKKEAEEYIESEDIGKEPYSNIEEIEL